MAYLTADHTLAKRLKLEARTELSPEDLAELAHVLMIDYLRRWNGATEENIDRAREYLKQIDGSKIALAHVAEGQIREADGNLPGAINEFKEALRIDPDLSIAHAHKANALILHGQAEKAPGLLAKAISSHDPDLGLCYWFMGRAYFNMENYKDAIWWLKKSVKVRPGTWFSWAHLISAYALTGQLQQGDCAKAALATYKTKFQPDWPLDKIEEYYEQAKYITDPAPQLQKALEKDLEGLRESHEAWGVP